MVQTDFNNKKNLSHNSGTIVVTSDNESANVVFNVKTKNQELGLYVYSLSKLGVFTQSDVDDFLDIISANRLNSGATESALGNTDYNYRPRFLLAVNDFEDEQTFSKYLYQQMVHLGFDVEEANLHSKYVTLSNFADKDKEGFEQQVIETIENPENNFNNFLDTITQSNRKPISTGISVLDFLLDGGLYEGLYVLGAGSGMGKTSLALQIADYIAENGKNVLYFALEMSPEELIAKSLSRITWSENAGDGYSNYKVLPTARNILLGDWRERFQDPTLLDLLNKATNHYKSFTARMIIPRRALSRPTASEIVQKVENYIFTTKKKPVVFIDYLQLLRSENDHATDKQNITAAINKLKILSVAYHIPVIVISSFNRSSYNRLDVDLDAFKESGDIEYTADVILTLENDLSYIKIDDSTTLKEAVLDTKNKEWDEIRASKFIRNLNIRPLKLSLLKNRFGSVKDYAPLKFVSSYSKFGITNYDGTKQLFTEDTLENEKVKTDWLDYIDTHKRFLVDNNQN